MFLGDWEIFTFMISRFLLFDYSIPNFYPRNLLTNALVRVTIQHPQACKTFKKPTTWSDHNSANKIIRSLDVWPHQMGADFTTTYLTTFRTGLPGDSSTRRTLYQFFRTKKHVLDAISRKKTYPFAWGSRDPKCKNWPTAPLEITGYYHSLAIPTSILFSCYAILLHLPRRVLRSITFSHKLI